MGYTQSVRTSAKVWIKAGFMGKSFSYQIIDMTKIQTIVLLKRVNLGRMDRQCQKEHSNHTLVTALEHTGFALVFRPKPDVLLSSDAVSKAEHF